MADFQKKQNSSVFWHSPMMLFFMLFVVLIFMYNIVGLIEKSHDSKKKKELMLSQIEALKSREENLTKNIEKLNTDLGSEEAIRDKYQMVKEGEKMVVIVDEDFNSKDESQTASVEASSEKGVLNFFKNLFK